MHKKSGKDHSTARVAAAFVIALVFAVSAVAVPVAVSAERLPVVVVDAGHGGADGGVTGVNSGVKESDLNLAMSRLIGECLESLGFKAVYTRKGRGGLYCEEDDNKKSADMAMRGAIIRRTSPVAVISVHMNTFHDRSRRGAQVFFDGGSESGRALAQSLQDALNSEFNLPDAGRGFAPLSADKYILKQTSAPSVIVECGFLSNPADEAHLLDADYTARFARAVAAAVSGYFGGA